MRLIGRPELHLTLHFLGEIADEKAGEVRQALASVKVNAFAITLKGMGRFPLEGQPKVIWSGVETSPALIALHRTVGTALTNAIGFRPEERLYSPHVTLAYLNTAPSPGFIEQHLEENQEFHIPGVLIDQIALYSSLLIDDVPRYQCEAVFQLSDADDA
jgi:2'-5' RNA ligase